MMLLFHQSQEQRERRIVQMHKEELIKIEIIKSRAILSETNGELDYLHGFVRDCMNAHGPMLKSWKGWHKDFEISSQAGSLSALGIKELFLNATSFGPKISESLRPRYLSRIWSHDKVQEFGPENANTFFMSPNGFVELPNFSIRPGQSINKIVTRALSKVPKSPLHYNHYDLNYHWQIFMSLLSEERGIKSANWRVRLSFAPSDFLSLGHLGEEGSCYRTGHEYENAKLRLATQPDTFIGLIQSHNGDSRARFWGRLVRKGDWKFLAITNLYMMNWASAMPIFKELAKQLRIRQSNERAPDGAGDSTAFGLYEEAIYSNELNVIFGATWNEYESYASSFEHASYGKYDFNTIQCSHCGVSIERDEEYSCNDCDERFCGDCVTHIANDGIYLCASGCMDPFLEDHAECEHCNGYATNEEINSCEECNAKYCNSCKECWCVVDKRRRERPEVQLGWATTATSSTIVGPPTNASIYGPSVWPTPPPTPLPEDPVPTQEPRVEEAAE